MTKKQKKQLDEALDAIQAREMQRINEIKEGRISQALEMILSKTTASTDAGAPEATSRTFARIESAGILGHRKGVTKAQYRSLMAKLDEILAGFEGGLTLEDFAEYILAAHGVEA